MLRKAAAPAAPAPAESAGSGEPRESVEIQIVADLLSADSQTKPAGATVTTTTNEIHPNISEPNLDLKMSWCIFSDMVYMHVFFEVF